MLVSWRKIFNPTPEGQKRHEELMEKLAQEYDEASKNVKLMPYNSILYVSEPFISFDKDYEHCLRYEKSPYDFVEGGECKKHYIGCGWGFTCNDWTGKN